MLSRSPTEMEIVNLDRAVEHVLPRRHETQRVSHPPGRRLAHPQSLGQAHRGQAFIRLRCGEHLAADYWDGRSGSKLND